MQRGSHFISEIDRLAGEAELVLRSIVLPGWLGPNHGMPDTLYGYMMGVFSRIDLISAHWSGSYDDQSVRMVSFMDRYIQPNRTANSLAVQLWRHKLMHTSSPRALCDPNTGSKYLWLLHWADDHLPREQHFTFQAGGTILNLSLMGLIANTRDAAAKYIEELNTSRTLESKYDVVAHELETYAFRTV